VSPFFVLRWGNPLPAHVPFFASFWTCFVLLHVFPFTTMIYGSGVATGAWNLISRSINLNIFSPIMKKCSPAW
jgi:hypothetical protein